MFLVKKSTNVIFIGIILAINIALTIYFKFTFDMDGLMASMIAFYLLYLLSYYLSKQEKLQKYYNLIEMLLLYTLVSNACVFYSYLMSAFNMPMIDATLAQIDTMMGFSWQTHYDWLKNYFRFYEFLTFIYLYFFLQMLIIIPLYCFWKGHDDIQKMLFSFALTLFLCVTISVLLPAWGGHYHTISQTHGTQYVIDNFGNVDCANNFMCDLLALRNGSLRHISMKFHGMMTFPSFHAAASTLFALYFFRFKYVNIITTPLNILIIYSALSIGMHHLIDIIAGTLLAFVVYGSVYSKQSAAEWLNVKAFRTSSPMPSS